MNFITASIIMAVAITLAACALLRTHINAEAAEASASRYEQQAQGRSTMLASACTKGQAGVVLYYKGKACTR